MFPDLSWSQQTNCDCTYFTWKNVFTIVYYHHLVLEIFLLLFVNSTNYSSQTQRSKNNSSLAVMKPAGFRKFIKIAVSNFS